MFRDILNKRKYLLVNLMGDKYKKRGEKSEFEI
jgi:hypothetical protein